jgi:hypothetical protein
MDTLSAFRHIPPAPNRLTKPTAAVCRSAMPATRRWRGIQVIQGHESCKRVWLGFKCGSVRSRDMDIMDIIGSYLISNTPAYRAAMVLA